MVPPQSDTHILDKGETPVATNSSSSSEKGVNDLFNLNSYNDFSYEDWMNGGYDINLHWLFSLFILLVALNTFET